MQMKAHGHLPVTETGIQDSDIFQHFKEHGY